MNYKDLARICHLINPLKVVVTGGRDYKDEKKVIQVLNLIRPRVLIAGGATGVDTFAVRWAEANGIKYTEILAEWSKYGNAAGPIRNREMLKQIQDTGLLLAFPGGRGTKNCVETARHLKIPVVFVEDEE